MTFITNAYLYSVLKSEVPAGSAMCASQLSSAPSLVADACAARPIHATCDEARGGGVCTEGV